MHFLYVPYLVLLLILLLLCILQKFNYYYKILNYTINLHGAIDLRLCHRLAVLNAARYCALVFIIMALTYGALPAALAISAYGDAYTAPIAYVCGQNFTAIDLRNNQTVFSIIGHQNPRNYGSAIAVSPDGERLYVCDSTPDVIDGSMYESKGRVIIYDTSNGSIIDSIPVGINPYNIAISPDGSRIYVSNPTSANVMAIDAANDTMIAAIENLGDVGNILVSNDGKRAYVSDSWHRKVYVINCTSFTLEDTIDSGEKSDGLCFSSSGDLLYVTSSSYIKAISTKNDTIVSTVRIGGNAGDICLNKADTMAYVVNDASITVADMAKGTIITGISLDLTPITLMMSPDDRYVYALSWNRSLLLVNSTTFSVDSEIDLESYPRDMAMDLKNHLLYVLCEDYVIVIDMTDNKITDRLDLGYEPFDAIVSADGSRIYICDHGSGKITVLDSAAGSLIDQIQMNDLPISIALDNGRKEAYVAAGGNISVIDLSSDRIINNISVDGSPGSLCTSPDGTRIYAVMFEGRVCIIDAANETVDSYVNVGKYPRSIASSLDGRFLYVANSDSNNVSVIDTGSKRLVTSIPTENCPVYLAICPGDGLLYVSNAESRSISIFDTNNNLSGQISLDFEPGKFAFTGDGSMMYAANYVLMPVFLDRVSPVYGLHVLDIRERKELYDIPTPGARSIMLNPYCDFSSPCIKSITPIDNCTNAPAYCTIAVCFNEAMNTSTINNKTLIVLGPNNTPLEGTVSICGRVATFVPVQMLSNNTSYMVKITNGICDDMGFSLKDNFTYTFVTAPEEESQREQKNDVPACLTVVSIPVILLLLTRVIKKT